MSYRLQPGEKLSRGICRIARKQTRSILTHLEERSPNTRQKATHDARKALKRVRALLRLVRTGLGVKIYRQENRSFRTIAHSLSPRRDAEVLLQTLNKLGRQHHDKPARAGLAKLGKVFLKRNEELLPGSKDLNKKVVSELRHALRRMKRHPWEDLKWTDLCRGLKRAYGRGMKALPKARQNRSVENLHEWRKRVKDVGYHLRLLEPLSPRIAGKLAWEAEQMADTLGDDHDLAMLEKAARHIKLAPLERASLFKLMDPHRTRLQQSAFDAGERFYREQPAAFTKRIMGSRAKK